MKKTFFCIIVALVALYANQVSADTEPTGSEEPSVTIQEVKSLQDMEELRVPPPSGKKLLAVENEQMRLQLKDVSLEKKEIGSEEGLSVPSLSLREQNLNKRDKKKGMPFPNPQFGLVFIGITSLENEAGIETVITGVEGKARQKNKRGSVLVGGVAHYFKINSKTDESFVYMKKFGGGLSVSLGRTTGWTDIDICFDRFETEGEVRGTNVSWKEKINTLTLTTQVEFRREFEEGFSLTRTKLFFHYVYPLSGERKTFIGGVEKEEKEAPSNLRSLYFRIELTILNFRISKDWATTTFIAGGYDHQSWNQGDYYSPGFGLRLNRKDVEVVSLAFENRFKSSGPNAGEPRICGTFNVLPLFDIAF